MPSVGLSGAGDALIAIGLEVGKSLLQAGIQYGTARFQGEMQARMAKEVAKQNLTNQIAYLERQYELEARLAEQAAAQAPVAVAASDAAWVAPPTGIGLGVAALAALYLLLRR